MTKHTPGNWQIQDGAWGIYVFAKDDEAEKPYKVIMNIIRPNDEEKANAKLIAAAPEMLAALQAALKLSDDSFNADKAAGFEIERTPECQAVYDQVKAVIEKATI